MTIEEIIAEVRKRAREYPDNIYQNVSGNPKEISRCSYIQGRNSHFPQMGCIFSFLNVLPDFVDHSTIDVVLFRHNIKSFYWERYWCKLVQSAQDRNNTWRDAVKAADEASLL